MAPHGAPSQWSDYRRIKEIITMASIVVNALAPHLVRGARMGVHWAGPRVTAAGTRFVEASHAARDFVRQVAVENFEALTESEYREATDTQSEATIKAEHDLIELDDDQAIAIVRSTSDSDGQDVAMKPRDIRLHCQTIRASRELLQMADLGGVIPQLSHWCVEVGREKPPEY